MCRKKRPPRHPVDLARPDEAEHVRRRRVVRALDHRIDQPVIGRPQRPVAHAWVVEVGDQQHRLEHARRRHRARRAPAPRPMLRAQREADHTCARVCIGDRRMHVRLPLRGSASRPRAREPSRLPHCEHERRRQQPETDARSAGGPHPSRSHAHAGSPAHCAPTPGNPWRRWTHASLSGERRGSSHRSPPRRSPSRRPPSGRAPSGRAARRRRGPPSDWRRGSPCCTHA
jgi:hypothetical protein